MAARPTRDGVVFAERSYLHDRCTRRDVMTLARRAAGLAFVVTVYGVPPCVAQNVGALTQTVLTPQEMGDFLLQAPIVAKKGISKGVTSTQRVTLSDGRMTHDAQVQNVDIFKPFFDLGPGYSEA